MAKVKAHIYILAVREYPKPARNSQQRIHGFQITRALTKILAKTEILAAKHVMVNTEAKCCPVFSRDASRR